MEGVARLYAISGVPIPDGSLKTKEKAGKLGMKATQYAQEIALKGGIKSRFTLEELDKMRKLSGMANNLNQITRKIKNG